MHNASLLSLLFVVGCASTDPTLTIKFDSNPRGAPVFVKNKTRVGRLGIMPARGEMGLIPEWDPVGTTPFTLEWPLAHLSDYHENPIVFEARPPEKSNGLYTKREACDSSATNSNGNSTCKIFFDLTKP
jgi:hypothetical protein